MNEQLTENKVVKSQRLGLCVSFLFFFAESIWAQQQPQTPEPPKAISVAEAARLVGRTEACVRSWCAVYGIGIKIDGRHWKVSRSLLRALLVDRHGEDVLPHGLR